MNLDGPRAPPAAGGKPKSLAILLHGYGSNGEDLISLAPYWAKALPNTQFVAPNAPEPVPGAPMGFQWFPIAGRIDPRAMEEGVARASQGVDKLIDRELERYGLGADRLALVGFSQGTMMSLHVGLRRAAQLAGVLGFSGMLAGRERLKAEMKSKPPVALIHGDQDDMIPLPAMFDACDALSEAGHGAQWHVSYGIPHSIGPDGLELGAAFLKMAFAARPAVSLG